MVKNGFYSLLGILGQLLASYLFLISLQEPPISSRQKNPRAELKLFLTIFGTGMRAKNQETT